MKSRIPHPFIQELKEYNLFELLYQISFYSGEILKEKTSSKGIKNETVLCDNGRQHSFFVTAWSLIDISYLAIKYCSEEGGKIIKSKQELAVLLNNYNSYHEAMEQNQSFMNKHNDFLLYLYGFFGEQMRFQNYSQTITNYCRNQYILTNISSRHERKIDITQIIHKEVGLSVTEISTILMYLWTSLSYWPYVFIPSQIKDNEIITEEKIMKVCRYYSASVSDIRANDLRRQFLYSKPIIEVSNNKFLCVNCFLMLFSFESSTYWILRNYYQKQRSQQFINTFGLYFEEYFEEVLETYLNPCNYNKIPEGATKKADWKITIGKYTLLIEQKSALVGLMTKQQVSDIEQTKTYFNRNWIEALNQLSNSEKDYALEQPNRIIKIILVYEHYFKEEVLENVFSLNENTVENDGYYWAISIDDMEKLLYTYKNDSDTFNKIIEEKILLETTKSLGGREMSMLFNKYSITENLHIKNIKYYQYYTSIQNAFRKEVKQLDFESSQMLI